MNQGRIIVITSGGWRAVDPVTGRCGGYGREQRLCADGAGHEILEGCK